MVTQTHSKYTVPPNEVRNHKIRIELLQKPWQQKKWVPILAILLGYIPPLTVFISQLFGGPVTALGYMLYAMGYTLVVIAILLLLLRFLCGEKPGVLNLRPGVWWKDILGGIGLVVITFSMKLLLDPVIARYFYRASDVESGMVSLVNKLADNPWLAALFLGPALFIGVAGSEELTRMFFITRWMKISSSKVWLGVGIFLSAFLFGLNHVAQGTAGVISVTLNALIMVLWYLRFGRIFHLIVAHYLYDAVQLGPFILLLMLKGTNM
jgi:membrane protease YdiL (CAAX protease family)